MNIVSTLLNKIFPVTNKNIGLEQRVNPVVDKVSRIAGEFFRSIPAKLLLVAGITWSISRIFPNSFIGKKINYTFIFIKIFTEQRFSGLSHAHAYASSKAAGKSDEWASAYASHYAEQRKAGKPPTYASAHAYAKSAGKSDEWAATYTNTYAFAKANGKSDDWASAYATQYANQREARKPRVYAIAYAEAKANGKSDEWASAYANQREARKSHVYAHAYASAKGSS